MPCSGGRRSRPRGSSRSWARPCPPAGSTWPTRQGSATAFPRRGERAGRSAMPADRAWGEHERGRPAELLGLAVPAQRAVLKQVGTYLIGIATEGVKVTDLSADP